MNNTMKHKDYIGSVEFSESDGLFFGKVIGIRSLISYEGTTAKTLIKNFHEAVDDYLALCKEKNEVPERAYKGSFNVRVSPQLHKQAVISASTKGMTLNSFVEKALENYVATQG